MQVRSLPGGKGLSFLTGALFLILGHTPAHAADILVPSQQPTLQAAIAAAQNGDSILIADGTYRGALNKNLDPGGKAITIRSAGDDPTRCIIDCESAGRAFVLQSGETSATVIRGLTVRNGRIFDSNSSANSYGGGLLCLNSNPTIVNCIFADNQAFGGGGIYCSSSSPTLTDCVFTGNDAINGGNGGGMYAVGSSPHVTNCIFRNNTGWSGGGVSNLNCGTVFTNCAFLGNYGAYIGGGISHFLGTGTFINCTITGNNTPGDGGAIYNGLTTSVTLTNCIVYGNTGDGEVSDDSVKSPTTITYSDVQGGYPGTGNIDADPLFFDVAAGDVRLLAGSPCIDAGNNAAFPGAITVDLAGDPRFVHNRIDMGAYEYQLIAALDVTAQVQITRSGLRRNAATGRFVQTLTLKNTSSSPINGPVSLVLDSLTNGVSLLNPTGTTSATPPTGSPYLNVTTGNLSVGASVTVTLEFVNPANAVIAYSPRVLAGAGSR